MNPPVLVIANKNYSSWSLRAWLLLSNAGIAFDEIRIKLGTPETKERILGYSPAGRLPVLLHGKIRVWESMWTDCLKRYGGPFLFGAFSIADAMYAPVASRFLTYDVKLAGAVQQYAEAVLALPAMQEWYAAAVVEPELLADDEPYA